MATEKELLTARLFTRAVFPVIKVLLNDDPITKAKFAGVTAKVQFLAKNEPENIGAYLIFNDGELTIEQGITDNPDIQFSFPSVKKMNDMLSGKPVLPSIKGFLKLGLLIKVFGVLLKLKLMMPSVRPKDDIKKYLKVKMALYMVSTALSQLNKGGEENMIKWTAKQPDRIYQLSVEGTDIGVYLRVKAGNSKSGRGMYTRKRPFVHMKFNGLDGALSVLLKDVDFVSGVGKGYVSIEGAPEYAAQLNDFMQRIQAMTT